jgi:hypothetical protein
MSGGLLEKLVVYNTEWNKLNRELDNIHWVWKVLFPVGLVKQEVIFSKMSKLTKEYGDYISKL